jgi:hypothetical protein
MKYLKTKDAITIIGTNTKIIGKDDPLYEVYRQVVDGEIPESTLKTISGDFSSDLGDFALEVSSESDRADVYFRGAYQRLPDKIYKWIKRALRTNQSSEAFARCVRSMLRSEFSLEDWANNVYDELKIDQDGRLIMAKKDEDELDGVEVLRTRTVNFIRDEDFELKVGVWPEDLSMVDRGEVTRYFVIGRNK